MKLFSSTKKARLNQCQAWSCYYATGIFVAFFGLLVWNLLPLWTYFRFGPLQEVGPWLNVGSTGSGPNRKGAQTGSPTKACGDYKKVTLRKKTPEKSSKPYKENLDAWKIYEESQKCSRPSSIYSCSIGHIWAVGNKRKISETTEFLLKYATF